MLNFLKFNKNNSIALIISLVLCLLISVVYQKTNLLVGLENSSLNFRYYLRDPQEASKKLQEGVKQSKLNPKARKDIVIIGIDSETLSQFNSFGIQWPFPWSVHEKVARYLASGKPKAILFDIMFVDNKPFEGELADAFKSAGNILTDYTFEMSELSDPEGRKVSADRIKPFAIPVDPDDKNDEWVKDVVPPTELITSSAKGIGFANVVPDNDNVVRKVPLIIKFQGSYYPSISLTTVIQYLGITKDDVEVKIGKFIKLKNIPIERMVKPNENREMIIPIDGHGFMDVNYIGGAFSYNSIPYFLYFRDGEEPENSSLKDKILLVAVYSVTGVAKDEHESPYGKIFGVEHLANAINTILNQDFIINLKPWQNVMIFLCIALFLGFFMPRMNILWSSIVAVFGVLAYVVISYILFDQKNIISAFSTPIIQISVNFTLIVVYRVLTEQKEKKYIRQTFSKFVSKSVVDELLHHPEKLKLGGDKKILSVLFSDIRGFTSLSETKTPEELVEHLNEYLQAMTDVVIKYDGTLDKYVGDEIMAFWGAPIPQEDHALRACKAALTMMEVLDNLNKNWDKLGKPKLAIGIGVNTGAMVVGMMGSISRMDYTLMGDNVNLGARLEGTNKIYGTYIIISEFTYEHVKDHVLVRELDLIRVKGKAHPVKIYELVDVYE